MSKRDNYLGIYEGKIVSTLDYDKLNRVRVRIPAVHGILEQTKDGRGLQTGIPDEGLPLAYFAMPFYPMSMIPPVGTVVFVSFINGIVDQPVIIGCRANYNNTSGSDIPDVAKTDYVNMKVFKTDKFTIYVDDTNEVLKMYSGDDYIVLDAKNNVLKLNGDSSNLKCLVLGENFAQLFNGHIHATAMGPSGPALDPTFIASPMDNASALGYPHLTRKAKTGA